MRLFFVFAAVLATMSVAFAGPSEEARNGFQAQMDAWNRGDLDGAMRFYRDHADMLFVSKAGVERGIASFRDAMRADFGGKPEMMGVFSGEVLEARDLGPNHALVVARWSIVLGEKRLFGGVSTQIWQRFGSQWRIAVEHAS
jgi:ketosteroid isomerase-like protein